MRNFAMIAVAAAAFGGTASAATINLTYNITAEVTEGYRATTSGVDPSIYPNSEYTGPVVGEIVDLILPVMVDSDTGYFEENGFSRAREQYEVDLSTGALFAYIMPDDDSAYSYDLEADGTGEIFIQTTILPEGSNGDLFDSIKYDVLSWSVDGLPEMTDVAPVPLPGAMPLLLVALAGAGWVARRRSS
ncbi:putative secreted protein [Palleronia aestuarii]|uniref:Putative secreted protein n=1 Tax=Palleronia aestuarii TaxID=568105 RepID=A0A2W7P5R5_9RHOB|nr:VPLPA-CTERM sorting domain-containing protein [Palleronia aestuarii]PZX18752.1 putative secreted protein [Palleronia aestuarii]